MLDNIGYRTLFSFYEAVELYKRLRARFDQRRMLKNEYELLIKFDEHTYNLFGLYQQAIVGDINVPSTVCLYTFVKIMLCIMVKKKRDTEMSSCSVFSVTTKSSLLP
uniref:Transposase n=1 Tax=Ascaris lumbricoides TaxID=6252 RepID=A0A0M3IVT5_ASCLU